MASRRLDFIDTTLRDGNQSLWGATGLRTGMMLEIAPDLDRAGFRAIDFSTSTHMAVTVRFHKENPWERIRLMKARMPRTPLSFLSTVAAGEQIFLAVVGDTQWAAFCDAFGFADLKTDARLAGNNVRVEARDWLIPLLRGRLAPGSATELA